MIPQSKVSNIFPVSGGHAKVKGGEQGYILNAQKSIFHILLLALLSDPHITPAVLNDQTTSSLSLTETQRTQDFSCPPLSLF